MHQDLRIPRLLPGGRVLVLLALTGAGSAAQAPAGYYDPVDPTTQYTLRATLHEVIDDHTRFPYTSGSTDTWDILEAAMEDPGDANRIVEVYRNASYPKAGGGNSNYNREHSWPSSYGFTQDGFNNYPYTDCHALFLVDSAYNSDRSNKPYRTCDPGCTELTTDGGGSGTYPGNSNWTSGSFSSGTWETWMGRRGDVARAILYMDLRYEGGLHGVTLQPEPNLIVTDVASAIEASSNTSSNEMRAHMGDLQVLLQWHLDDPVDQRELDKNDVVFSFQGNRNPFVDHPEWVAALYDADPHPPLAPWINEFHYDNAGTDIGEFVEVAGLAGTDLSGWKVQGYNGVGNLYRTVLLSGVLPDQGNCLGTLDFTFAPMRDQTGSLALVDPSNTVVHFISYEGEVTAQNAAAAGLTPWDVLVEESSTTTPFGFSLQLGGSGTRVEDFAWQGPQSATRGLPNAGQTLADACTPTASVYGCGVNPAGSMTIVAGAATLGGSITLGADNPVGTQAVGSIPVFSVHLAPWPTFPCGLQLPNFGMNGPGELLVGILPGEVVLEGLIGTVWSGPGNPATFTLPIPNDPRLLTVELFMQATMFDPTAGAGGVRFGLTDAARMTIGP